MKRLSIIFIAAIAILASSCSNGRPALSTFLTSNNPPVVSMVFSSNMTGNTSGAYNIYAIKPDGSGLTMLTGSQASYTFPTWSGARQKIAVVSNSRNLYLINGDGTGLKALAGSSDIRVIQYPAWSPDGSRLAFSGADSSGHYDVYTVTGPDQNEGLTRLTNNLSEQPTYPQWSPDGTMIAYITKKNDTYYRWVMKADGSDQHILVQGIGACQHVGWSPDSKRLAVSYNSGLDKHVYQIYTINEDGSGSVQLTDTDSVNAAPAWSPDGTKIAFHSDRDGFLAIYFMNADGSGQTRLTDSTITCNEPLWSPNGTEISYIGYRGAIEVSNMGLYVMNSDGTGQNKLAVGNIVGTFSIWATLPAYP